MPNYWCVNFEYVSNLHHGIKNSLWSMGYQYSPKKGQDKPGRKSAIARNWNRLKEIAVGDKFVAYLPGNKFFATASVIEPRRPPRNHDVIDTIADYLKRGVAYKKGIIYFPPTVAYENFADDSGPPVRVDVVNWQNFVPDGVSVDLPVLPRPTIVYAAFKIDKNRFDRIEGGLIRGPSNVVIPEEIEDSKPHFEGAVKTITVNSYERNRKARAKCIEHHGWACGVCGYDLAELYGKLGEGVIHVHHLRDLATLGKEYEVDPIKDLRPVCPNCHAILHTTSPAMSIKKLRKIIMDREPIQWPNNPE